MQPNKLNRVVNALMVTSIVLLSGTVVAGVYGMTFGYRLELHWSSSLYAWAFGCIFAIAALIWRYRHITWL